MFWYLKLFSIFNYDQSEKDEDLKYLWITYLESKLDLVGVMEKQMSDVWPVPLAAPLL